MRLPCTILTGSSMPTVFLWAFARWILLLLASAGSRLRCSLLFGPFRCPIRNERAYCLAADADLIISCVDNAEARDVLNHLAYSNSLPLIDGGVDVDSPEGHLRSARWRVHLAGPDMRCLRCRNQYTSSEAADERQGLRRKGRYINPDESSNPEPGQNTFAFCNFVAAEEIRILLRYLVGESWWHGIDPSSGFWSFEHRFVDAYTEPFEHPSACVSSCEFAYKRLGLGKLGRPSYPFLPEPRDHWSTRARRWFRRLHRTVQCLLANLLSF